MNSSPMLQRVRAVPARAWFGLALLVVALVFILQNRASTSIEIFTLMISAPLWLILVISVAVGLLVGVLLRTRRKA
ncbi:LapA family protein [Saccharopolyspora mangrovi]|uniref:DUF1049 domain-containing protein n=1 Tax=Saccharopolyspora mangrovi TaxID=3082379 RepID=A0ABU6ACD1_9PSEU|nr:DUF1049 domain-containing protein [Saccharopolyspora sp. S2-29]MEB3368985.1 DUF1049 domain-containing protein [Saccharopolyspora sp. S2-29]